MRYYVYVLKSSRDSKNYVGFTKDLKRRLLEHGRGQVQSTKHRRPLELVYYEVSFSREDATHREKYLKSAYGKRYLKNRLKNQSVGVLLPE